MMPSTPESASPAVSDDASAWQAVRQLSHDLNNLVGIIGGYAEMLLEETPQDAAAAEDLGRIREAAERAAEAIAALTALSRRFGGTVPPPSL
jgi:signal transduction histidine kinase